MDQANAWIDHFVEDYNMRFSKPPAIGVNLHRPLMDYEDLDGIFTWQEQRSLSASLTLQYDKVLYLVDTSRESQRLAGKRVTVLDYPDGRIKIHYEGRDLEYRAILATLSQEFVSRRPPSPPWRFSFNRRRPTCQ
jgi:hypothetical protein